jgi:hypothetical protein
LRFVEPDPGRLRKKKESEAQIRGIVHADLLRKYEQASRGANSKPRG